MSRIGKKTIIIPEKVEIKKEGRLISIKGPKGELSLQIMPQLNVDIEDGKINVSLNSENDKDIKFWGLTRSLINNMVEGVSNGFQKKLQIEGVGYRADMDGENIIFKVGFSHPVKFEKPEGVSISVEKNIVTVEGIDKQKVGLTAARIKKIRPPEPYKGKGIRYVGEVIKKKVGKKVAA